MKRVFSLLLLFGTFLLSCSKENGTEGKQETTPVIVCVTSEATGVTQTSAILNGTASIKNAKSSSGNAYFYYSTSQLDAKGLQTSGQRISAGTIPSSGGNFDCNLPSLTAATTYYYIASVSIDNVEELGNVKSFTTEKKTESISSTGGAIDITTTSAILCAYANITADIKGDVILGIIYSTNSNPTLQNGKLLTSNDLDASNMYKVEAKDLKPLTKYYYKSMLSNGNLNYYGEVKDFTTAQVLASVSTLDAWDIEREEAKAGGKVSVSSKGDVKISACIYCGTEGTSLETLKSKGVKVSAEKISDDGTFSVEVSGLKAETKYNYVAVASVEDVEFAGEIKSFTTADKPAESIITGDCSDMGESSAKVYGICSQEGSAGLSVVYGIEYSKTDLTTAASSVKATEKDSDNKFCCQLSNLSSNTLYYYRAYSLFNGVRSYGEVKSFSTKDFTATVVANTASNIAKSTATLNGKLSVSSIETLSKSICFYYSATETTASGIKTNGTKVSSNLQSDGTFSADISGLSRETDYRYIAYAKVYDKEFISEVKTFKTLKPSCPTGAVDLGLSVCWATCNIGASKPEEYGGYYQWAGTKDVTDASIYLGWSNCPYHTGSSSSTGWTKYIPSDRSSYWSGSGSPDNKTVLDPEDDVAHVKLGGKWRMPTYEEWAELRNNCTSEWTTLNGVKGRKFTSEKNGNSIFLPAAGYRYSNYRNSAGSDGNYWSSSLNTDDPYDAYDLVFTSGGVGTGYDYRCLGRPVRPVSD